MTKENQGAQIRPAAPGTPPEPLRTPRRAHEDGFSCRTPAAIRYDANGWKRWCIDCGSQLDERAYDENGQDVPIWFYILLLLAAAVVALVIALPAALVGRETNPGACGGLPATPCPPQRSVQVSGGNQ